MPTPMLADTWSAKGSHMPFPAFGQRKIDGARMLYDARTHRMSSRSAKTAWDVPRIAAELRAAAWDGLTLDGELYVHGRNFQQVMRMIHAGDAALEYHVFDVVSPKPYEERARLLEGLFARNAGVLHHVKLVPTVRLATRAAVEPALDAMLRAGYELGRW